VHPDSRRRGIATALVAHAVAHAESLGAIRVSAETLFSWPAAVGFWRSVGFEQES
jgi:GNAT superfamily N-acetyltransferase